MPAFASVNRLASIRSLDAQQSTFNSYDYRLNAANQRVRSTLADGSYWLYEYDSLGQVRSGRKYWSDQTPVAGQQFDYTFDTIGNRTQTQAGGDQNGANLRSASYSTDNLNRYSSRDVPGAVDVMGLGFATNAVTVNGQTAYRKGEYFRKEVPVSNGSVPVWQSVTNAATGQTSITGNVFVPKTQEQFGYDADGNLTSDGRWTYGWDGENRLVTLTTNTAVGPQQSIRFEYDWKGRRIHKQVWSNAVWSGAPTNDVKLVYDGWKLLAELNGTNNAVIRSFMWGSDLSGTIQGAGGVGGLLEVIYKGAQTTNCFVAFDGNGNVAALADAGSGSVLAQYEYGPFGEVLRASGPMAKANPFRFSTKYQDDETDLLYYGYRYYNASTGRWNSRDPLGDEAFQEVANIVKLPAQESYGNDYLFVHNSTLSTHDFLGLCDVTTSGSGSVSGGLGTVIIHHPFPGIHTHYPPVTDTFTLQCPASKPYLAIWGLSSSTYSPWYDSFPSGWGGSVSGGPVTYMVTIQVPSSTTVFMRRSQLAGLYVRGCCVCQSPGSIGRIDPPAPPPFPDDPYPYN